MNVHFQCVVQVCRSSCPEPQCGGAPPPPSNVDSYGAPAAAPVSIDTYGSPAAPPASINPRRPGGSQSQYQAGSQRRVSVVRPDAGPVPRPIPLNPEKLVLPQPGYSNFNKRVGLDTNTLGGKPRSLEFSEGEEIVNKEEKVDKKNEEDGETVVNSVEEEKERRRREATDGNGNRVHQVYRRVRRDAETENETESEEEVEQADIETQESVIRVVSPTDVQFKLDDQDKEEVVVNLTSPEALCLDTAAFVGVTISFLMLLVIAFI